MQLIRLLDIKLFLFFNHAFKNSAFDFLMPIFTQMGGTTFTFSAGLLCLFFRKREIRLMGIFLLAAAFIGNHVVASLKDAFMVPRPFIALKEVYSFTGAGGYSFPSGHASNAFLSATILSLRVKRKIVIYSLAVIVAFSRVYLGVHYPSDVIAGAVMGWVIGCFFVFLYRKFVNCPNISTK